MAHNWNSIISKGNHLYLRAAQVNSYSHLTSYHPLRLKCPHQRDQFDRVRFSAAPISSLTTSGSAQVLLRLRLLACGCASVLQRCELHPHAAFARREASACRFCPPAYAEGCE
jgi:hypothetical protein